jgi:hypothetical protein
MIAKRIRKHVVRITLFPPSGKRISQHVKGYSLAEGSLRYTDDDGNRYETTLPYAVEHIREGSRENHFQDAA